MKNITDTQIKLDIINISESPAAEIQFTNLLSLMGSITAADSLYINAIISILIIGKIAIIKIIINPKLLNAFFKSNEYPATVATASDKHFPTTGTKLSTVLKQDSKDPTPTIDSAFLPSSQTIVASNGDTGSPWAAYRFAATGLFDHA